MAKHEYDFIGWATRNDIRCADGRTIRHNAFIDNDGKRVPLVWNHNHSDIDNVLGYAILKNEDSVDEKADELIALANANGGSDNIGIVLWEVFK